MKNKEIEIPVIVNGRWKVSTKKILSIDEVILLTFPMSIMANKNTAFTVSWKCNGKGASLTKGDTIKVKDGMIFNVNATDKS